MSISSVKSPVDILPGFNASPTILKPTFTLTGAEVFKNINCTGAGDFVLGLNDLNSLYPLDVKTGWWEENPYAGKPRWRAMNGYKAKKPVYCVVVLPKPEGLTARWLFRSRARDPICPEGLENFWN